MANYTAHLYPFDTTSITNRIAQLPLASQITFTDGERQTGSGSITLPIGDPATTQALEAGEGRVIQIRRDGVPVFEFIVMTASRNLSDESGGTVVLSGP